MRLPELQQILIDGARRQDARRSSLLSARRTVLVALAALVLAGSATAAVVTLKQSRPLSGTVSAEFVGEHTAGVTHYRVSMFPYLSVGWSGWCSSVTFTVHARIAATSYGCAPVERANALQLSGQTFGGQGGAYVDAIVSDRVAEVRFADGVSVRTVSDPRLPSWARAAVRVYSPDELARIGAQRDFAQLTREELIGGDGQRLADGRKREAAKALPLTTVDVADPGDAACAIHLDPHPGLSAVAQTITRPLPWPRAAPGGFLACANATYTLAGHSLAAAVLVNASNPAAPAAQLPGLTHDRSQPSILSGRELGTIGYPSGDGVASFNPSTRAFDNSLRHEPARDQLHGRRDHDISAIRAGRGWLVVEGATAADRALLLGALHTSA
jgi:hypothetical protein